MLDRTYPGMGNHDRGLDNKGADYFAYFAGKTGEWGHYSLDLGAWHIVVLNAQCGVGEQNCRSGSPQEKWLKADLAATHQKCILHLYERYFPMNPKGAVAADGIREFVVGTGGAFLEPPILPPDASEMVRNATTYGYLKLTLFADSYEWQFVAQPGKSFTDSGSADCHR